MAQPERKPNNYRRAGWAFTLFGILMELYGWEDMAQSRGIEAWKNTAAGCLELTEGVKEHYKSGATRNSIGPYAWHLMSPYGLRELAAVMKEGEKSHGARNWERGMPRDTVINHMINHLMKYMEGDRSERHMGKVMAGAMFIAHYDALKMECPDE